jgi:PrgI family protein
MDQHPIPQDVTGFQFKLIGTMTVKQFGYVASGVIMAVILYYLPLHSAFGVLFKVLFVPLLGVSGVVIAFVPIDGRPIDVMTTNFLKALFSPNQYVYHRQPNKLSFETVSVAKAPPPKKLQSKTQTPMHTQNSTQQLNQKEEKLRSLLLNARSLKKNTIDKKETAFLESLSSPSSQTAQAETGHAASFQNAKAFGTMPPSPASSQQVMSTGTPYVSPQKPLNPSALTSEQTRDELSKKEAELEQALSQAKQEELENKTSSTHTVAEQKIPLLTKQIQQVHEQKQQLERELTQLQKQLASQKMQTTSLQKPAVSQQPIHDPQHVRVIPQGVSKKVGLPHVSDSPNVIVGIVKDPRGNIQPNILVEVKDKDGNPVRAFKTNQLGQFASATPLSLGVYTIELEDPKKQQRFDLIKITANNQILPPIEVISHDAREELRKQLFAN